MRLRVARVKSPWFFSQLFNSAPFLYAALDVRTGKVHGGTAARHTSQEFVTFLQEVVGQMQTEARDPRHPGQSFRA
jgi:hypothetical protein